MSTTVWPYISDEQRVKEEEACLARELKWLLGDLQKSLLSLRSGLEECVSLLAPQEPGSTLVLSSLKSEHVKGYVTRVGTHIAKGDIHLRLSTLPLPRSSASYPLHFSKDPGAPSLILTQLTLVRNLIYQSLDVVDVSTWTGDAHDPSFIAGQLRLLFDFIQEARQNLKGGEDAVGVKWWQVYTDEKIFEPPIPQDLSFHLSIHEASLLLTIRTLQPIDPNTPTSTFSTETLTGFSLRQRLGLVAKLPDHDESGETFMYRGQEVKVKEKVRVESQDPSLMAVMAKLSALEHALAFSRRNLMIVMGITDEDDEA